jgi:hypothetical protein
MIGCRDLVAELSLNKREYKLKAAWGSWSATAK